MRGSTKGMREYLVTEHSGPLRGIMILFFNTLTICGYVNNVLTSFYSVNIPYIAGKQAVVPIYNNEALAFLIKITVSEIGKIIWQTVYSVNPSLYCYITNVIGL